VKKEYTIRYQKGKEGKDNKKTDEKERLTLAKNQEEGQASNRPLKDQLDVNRNKEKRWRQWDTRGRKLHATHVHEGELKKSRNSPKSSLKKPKNKKTRIELKEAPARSGAQDGGRAPPFPMGDESKSGVSRID